MGHSKVMLFGPDPFVGSANADLRSYVLDTNSGLLIRSAGRPSAASPGSSMAA